MTIDKADLVKELAGMRGTFHVGSRYWQIIGYAIEELTQQAQGRDEVLEEAVLVALRYSPCEDDYKGTIAERIRALKSPSPAPVERRTGVEDRRKSAEGDCLTAARRCKHPDGRRSADRARWTGGGEKAEWDGKSACEDDPAIILQRHEERACTCGAVGSGEGHAPWCKWLSSPHNPDVTAQPEPQGLVKQYEEALVTIQTLLSYANVDMATEANKAVHINRAWHVATKALKSAAVTGGK